MKHLSPTDPVPSLRGDVVLSQRPTGSGAEVVHIRPIGFGEGMRLHGFELSIARMLDGRRSAEDVVSRASRLGLPLSVPALEGFINHLRAHGLIARTAGEAASAISPWSQRLEWDPLVREQYQTALKALRAGRAEEAQGRLERLLATAPLLDEARALRNWLADHPTGSLDGQAFHEVFARAEREWMKYLRTDEVVPLPSAEKQLDRAELRAVRPSFLPYIVLFAVVAALAALMFIPYPAKVSAPTELRPVTVTPAVAPMSGTLGAVNVEEGQWVNVGDPLVTYSEPEGTAINAETEGLVSNLTAAAGKPVIEGQQLLELQDTRQLRATATLDPTQASQVRPGQKASIALGNHRAEATVTGVSGREVVTTIDNTGNKMEPGNAVLDIEVGKQTLFDYLF